MRIRVCLIAVTAAALAACGAGPPGSRAPAFDAAALDDGVTALAQKVRPARLAVGVMDLKSAEVWSSAEIGPLPMQGIAMAPLGAAVLAEVDAGRLSLDEVIAIGEEDLSPQPSAISRNWPARRAYTVRELLALAVREADNTAADVLMKRIGGPGAVTAWLTQERVNGIRVDRYQRQIQMEIAGLGSFRPAWKDAAPVAGLPTDVRGAALAGFLADPQDTATVPGLLDFLSLLDSGEMLSPASRGMLLQLMSENGAGPARIRAVLPERASLAQASGHAPAALGYAPVVNDVRVATLPDGRRLAIVILLAGCRGEPAACEAVVADTARVLIDGAG